MSERADPERTDLKKLIVELTDELEADGDVAPSFGAKGARNTDEIRALIVRSREATENENEKN